MIRKLVYSLVIIMFCFNCNKKVEPQYKNPIFTTFFSKLNNSNINDFVKSYYKEKPDYILAEYQIALNQLKDSKSEIIISKYAQYKGNKLNIEGNTENIYILSNNEEIITFVKIEENKVKYLLPIHKGNELIGWL